MYPNRRISEKNLHEMARIEHATRLADRFYHMLDHNEKFCHWDEERKSWEWRKVFARAIQEAITGEVQFAPASSLPKVLDTLP